MNDALRDKIARALFDYTVKAYQVPESDMLHPVDFRNEADAVLAVLDVGEIRAEALRDVARVLTDALPESPSAAQTDRMKFAIGFLNASAEDPYERKEDQ